LNHILIQGSRVQGFKDSRIQGFKGSRVQGFKGSRVQGYASFISSGDVIGVVSFGGCLKSNINHRPACRQADTFQQWRGWTI
jgi:hypothetical protein